MIEILKQRNFDAIHFQPFIDYITYLESLGYKYISTKENYESITENYEEKDHNLKILTLKEEDMEWISIYKEKNNCERFEQIEFMVLNEEYVKFYGEQGYNRVIRYSAHFENEEFTRMVCSAYTYEDNKLIDGWRKLRKFMVADLNRVMYNKRMNLHELILYADQNIEEFTEKINLEGKEVKELVLGY